MRVMSGLDTRFLFSETPTAPMHTIKVVVVDVSARKEPLTPEGLPSLIGDRLGRMPILRRRVVPVPHGLANPVVIDDPDFDLSRHLRTTTVAAPGVSGSWTTSWPRSPRWRSHVTVLCGS